METPSYHVQSLFGNNKGDKIVESSLEVKAVKEKKDQFIKGGAGLGSIDTSVVYKDFTIKSLDGELLFEDKLQSENDIWNKVTGDWKITDTGFEQTNLEGKHLAIVENEKWTSYIVNVKAKKTGGLEGFLVVAGAKDKENYYVWNLAGWQNKFTAIQRVSALVGYEVTSMDPIGIENDRWYDLTVKVEGKTITCYLDGKEIHKMYDEIDYKDVNQTVSVKDNEVIIKTVNTSEFDYVLDVEIKSSYDISEFAEVITLKGNKVDENNLEEPSKVEPKYDSIDYAGKNFSYNFEKNSFTIIKLKRI